jgi:hypothetical protein
VALPGSSAAMTEWPVETLNCNNNKSTPATNQQQQIDADQTDLS